MRSMVPATVCDLVPGAWGVDREPWGVKRWLGFLTLHGSRPTLHVHYSMSCHCLMSESEYTLWYSHDSHPNRALVLLYAVGVRHPTLSQGVRGDPARPGAAAAGAD